MKNKPTILIVDDIADNLDVATQILFKDNLNFILAQNGKDALKYANKVIPDLILLDIMMPEMDGYEVCAKLKQNPITKEIPVIFLSAATDTENIVKGFEIGGVDYITKPFFPEELILRVNTHLKIHKQNQELRRKEQELQESKIKLSSVINSIPDLIFYKDINGKYTGVNKAFAKYIGEPIENIVGGTDYDIFNLKDAKTFIDADKAILNSNKIIKFKQWTQDFDGNKLFLETNKVAIKKSNGEVIGIVGVSRNITEQKIIEQQLKEKEEKLTKIYDNANEGIFILQNNKIVFLNNKLIEIIGYSKSELQERPFFEFIHPEDRGEALEYYKKKIDGQKIGKAIIFRVLNPSNENTYVRVNSKQIQWDANDAVLGLLDDVTEQFLLQKELKESKERLALSQKAGNVGSWEWDFKTDVIIWSDVIYDIFGIEKQSDFVTNDEFLKHVHPNDKERIINELNISISVKNTEHKTEFRIIDENNKTCWIEEISEIVYENSKAIKMLGILRDVTTRKKAEIALKQKNIEIKKNRDEIISSIRYAKTIQTSLLPEKIVIDEILPKNFIFYQPKDFVSGDFYYINKIENKIFCSVADCTGHGVPGGFITMLGINSIHGIINEKKIKKPSEILELLRYRIKDIFKGVKKDNNNGIDIAFCVIDTKTNILEYSGAFNPLWIVRNNELIELKATRNPIGFYPIEKEFVNHKFQLQNKDKIYLFSDGFKDQIGGYNNKKFNSAKFKELIITTNHYPINKQKKLIEKNFIDWKGNNEQVDDITIMGLEWDI